MKVVNISSLPRMVTYLGESQVLEPGDTIEVNPFRLEELQDISNYVVRGIFDILDCDLYGDDSDEIDAELMSLENPKPQIVSEHGSVFKNINFDNEI